MAEKKETLPVVTDTALPINSKEFRERQTEAIKRLVTGKTPLKEIKKREGRGGGQQKYVDIAYMTEQANFITGYRWKQEIIKEEEYKDKTGKVLELGVLVRVTFYANGMEISKEQWGQKDVMYRKDKPEIPLCYFDDKKAAISDGVKKCLSYFGIAADVYAGKELEFYLEDEGFEGIEPNERREIFLKMAKNLGYNRPSLICDTLQVKSLDQIEDYEKALKTLEEVKEKQNTTE